MSIFLIGDCHGSLYNFNLIKRKNKLTKDDFIIVLGDFGYYWEDSIEEHNKRKELAKLPCKILYIDGNHCSFDLLSKLPIKKMFDNEIGYDENYGFIHLKRGLSYTIQGKTFFCLGGAHSVDKSIRKEGISYWKEENISLENINTALKTIEKQNKYDYVLTHTCPISILKELEKQKLLMQNPPAFWIIDNSNEEILEEIKNKLEFNNWFFGHFHFKTIFNYENFYGLYEHYIKIV